MNYKYTLESYTGKKSRYTCPNCNKEHCFTRYMDTETGIHLAPHVGRCNREQKCRYHYKPKQFFEDNPQLKTQPVPRAINYVRYPDSTHPLPLSRGEQGTHQPSATPQHTGGLSRRSAPHNDGQGMGTASRGNTKHLPSHGGVGGGLHTTRADIGLHPAEEMQATLGNYEQNHLIQYLTRKLGQPAVDELLRRYHIGTHSHWAGSTVFWQVDHNGQVRAGKVMLYDPHTGKRVKQPHNHISWMHSLQKKVGFTLKQCFFGEHLLAHSHQQVAIAESEKAALIGSVTLPQFTWLATGGVGNISMLQGHPILRRRRVFLYPDCGMYERWKEVADSIQGCYIDHSLLFYEQHPDEGYDIADYFLGKAG